MWSDVELAYFAGILDGEGCFALHNFGKTSYCTTLTVGNTDPRLMLWLKTHFGGSVSREPRKKNLNAKTIWRWQARAGDIVAITQAVLPFLVLKRERAELLLAYRATVNPKVIDSASTARISDDVKAERHQIHAQLKALNQRGVAH